MDEALSCSLCHQRFSKVIKLITECGNSVCGGCHEQLKEDVDAGSRQYKCPVCSDEHAMPTNGLPDCKPLLKILQSLPQKPLHENAKTLQVLVKEVETQMEKLQSFDGKQVIESHCEQLEQEVGEAIESAIKHLRDIHENLLKQISEYRDKCLESACSRSSDPRDATKQEMTELTKEVNGFNARWNYYFSRIDVYEKESDIESALSQTAHYMTAMDWMQERMRKEALNWETMVFSVNSQFLQEWSHVGGIEILVNPKPGSRQEKKQQESKAPAANSENTSRKFPNPFWMLWSDSEPVQKNQAASADFSLKGKKMTIQETPSFTLNGHCDSVRQVLFLPGGRLASCSDDKTIKIWNVENGEELFEFRGHTHWVLSLAVLPNGHLASGSRDETIKIWDLEQRKAIRTIEGHANDVLSLHVLKNGNLASYSKDDTIKIWNLRSKEDEPISVMKGHSNTSTWSQMFGVFSNDCLVSCSRDTDGKESCTLRIWNPNKPNPVKTLSTGFNDVRSLLVLSNDQVALGFERGSIKILDLVNEALSRNKENAHERDVESLVQLSTGLLASTGRDGPNRTIKVWSLLDWSLLQTINTDNSLRTESLSISGDEKFLASGSRDKTIKLWPISAY